LAAKKIEEQRVLAIRQVEAMVKAPSYSEFKALLRSSVLGNRSHPAFEGLLQRVFR
jgi:hypothetical protein